MHIHAHLIIAPQLDTTLIPQEVRVSSADVLHASIAQFGIEDARSLTESASRRPIAASHRTFVLWTDTMTREAQNALLKLFEEPPAGGVFYLMVPDESMLIPTLRSRLIRAKMHALDTESGEAIAFLQCSYADRLATIAKLQKEKDTKRMQSIAYAVARMVSDKPGAYPSDAIRVATFVSSRMRTKGGSKKMLLEHLALSFPVGSR